MLDYFYTFVTHSFNQAVTINMFCSSGLGYGMLVGYRIGFLARPIYFTNPGHTYQKEHAGQKYNKREDGLIECAVSNSVNYIKVLILKLKSSKLIN